MVAKWYPAAVNAAFDMLLEEIEAVIKSIQSAGAELFAEGSFDAVEAACREGRLVADFKTKVAALRDEWNALCSQGSGKAKEKVRRRKQAKLVKGERTPEKEYYAPILRVLTQMGGSGKIGDVLNRVYDEMKAILKPVDKEGLSSDSRTPRWRNAAQWARNTMRREGLLRADSPRGMWQITEQGREWLERNG